MSGNSTMQKGVEWIYFMVWGTTLFVTGVWSIESIEVFVEEGSQAILPCINRPPSHTAAVIFWKKNLGGTIWRKEKSGLEYWGKDSGQRVRCPHSNAATGDYSLYIKEVRVEDAGEYTCRAEDGKQLVLQNVLLRVVQVSISLSDQLDGNTVSIMCSMTPWLWTATVSWRFNGEPFLPQNHGFIRQTFSNSSFSLKARASQNMTGVWTCIVHHQKRETNATRPLIVRGIVSPSSDDSRVYAAVGSAITLPCVYSSGLTPSNVLWERINKGSVPPPGSVPSLLSSFNLSSMTPWNMSIEVLEVGPEDGGSYRCSGSVGGKRLTRQMNLVTAQVLRNTPTSWRTPVTLTCHLSDTDEVIDYDWVQVTNELNGTQSVSPSVSQGKILKLGTVTEKTSGEWACRFYGKQGMLGNVTYRLPLIGGLSGDKEYSTNIATVVGLGFLLLVTLLIVVQMYRNYRRKQSILQFPALETIVHAQSNEREVQERHRVKDDF